MADISPIDTIEELWTWENRKDFDKKLEPLQNFKKRSGPQVLVCHDMKGGYLEDETEKGIQMENGKFPFTFLNWWQIDVFNYFSHHFVTIPPREYTRIAHKHGVLSLGTFITEWVPGKAICGKVLETKETLERTVDSLVSVARHFGFDGWLINVENEIEPEKIDFLVEFCRSLTEKSKISNENSRVIWYDSVLHNGKLKWQNELNEHNCQFYSACDAIYLNYNWTDHNLFRSAEFGELEKIYMGIDVWGRGCVGGFKCHSSFALAKLFRMSVALFAPGWIYEHFPEDNQILKGIQFWEKLYPHVRTRALMNANFSTNFCSGMDENWKFSLNSMDLQPQCLSSFCHPVVGKGLVFFGAYRKFSSLFTFSSLPFNQCTVICKSDKPIELEWNREKAAEKTEDSTWILNGPESLESIEIRTTDHDETVITYFSIHLS